MQQIKQLDKVYSLKMVLYILKNMKQYKLESAI